LFKAVGGIFTNSFGGVTEIRERLFHIDGGTTGKDTKP
jgi:hypothetical protein